MVIFEPPDFGPLDGSIDRIFGSWNWKACFDLPTSCEASRTTTTDWSLITSLFFGPIRHTILLLEKRKIHPMNNPRSEEIKQRINHSIFVCKPLSTYPMTTKYSKSCCVFLTVKTDLCMNIIDQIFSQLPRRRPLPSAGPVQWWTPSGRENTYPNSKLGLSELNASQDCTTSLKLITNPVLLVNSSR